MTALQLGAQLGAPTPHRAPSASSGDLLSLFDPSRMPVFVGTRPEGVPAHLSYDAVGRALASLPGVTGIHDLHVWQMSAERVALSAHLTLVDGESWPRSLASAQKMLSHDFGIDHVTLQPAWLTAPPPGRVIPVTPAAGPEPGRKPGRGLH